MEYVRYCPKCGREKIYRSLDSFMANKDSLLCRVCARKEVFSNKYPNKLIKLLEDTPEAYYWIGYLLADGHFYADRIKFTQNGIDKIRVENFKKYIEGTCDVKYNNKIDQASFSVMSVDVVPEIKDKNAACDYIYDIVESKYKDQAGKITGMLYELDFEKLKRMILQDRNELMEQIEKAHNLLLQSNVKI